jgi:hypothetical protein
MGLVKKLKMCFQKKIWCMPTAPIVMFSRS